MVLNFTKTMLVKGKRKPTNFEQKIKDETKIHTIRADVNNRWRPGMKIHFSTGARTGKYNQFMEGKCTAVQPITVDSISRMIKVEGNELNDMEMEDLSHNDGFDTIAEFWAWFDQFPGFKGKLIYWTNKKYLY
jgi:uncharacterized protein YqfB (UPF0267 family)